MQHKYGWANILPACVSADSVMTAQITRTLRFPLQLNPVPLYVQLSSLFMPSRAVLIVNHSEILMFKQPCSVHLADDTKCDVWMRRNVHRARFDNDHHHHHDFLINSSRTVQPVQNLQWVRSRYLLCCVMQRREKPIHRVVRK